MKKILLPLVLVLFFGHSVSIAEASVQWYSLKDGMEKTKKENKPMIVDFFYGKGCSRCERLQKNVYDDPIISKKINADFVPIRIDLTNPLTKDEETLGKKYEYKMDCLLLFLDPDGELITDREGKKLCFIDNVDPEWFVSYLDMIKKKYESKP